MEKEDWVKTLSLEPLRRERVYVFCIKCIIKNPEEVIEKLRKEFSGEISVIIDGDLVIDLEVIRHAALNALTFKPQHWIQNDSIRFLAFLACKRQINEALEVFGIRKGEYERAIFVVISEEDVIENVKRFLMEINGEPTSCDSIFRKDHDRTERIMRIYEIREEEIRASLERDRKKAIVNLIIERMNIMKIRI